MLTLLLIAARSLVQHRRRTLLLGGALAAVTALLVLLLGLSGGIRESMLSTATTLVSGHINIGGFYKLTPGQSASLLTNFQELRTRVEQEMPEVESITIRARAFAKLISPDGSQRVAVSGLDIRNEPRLIEALQILEGDANALEQPDTLLIFKEQAERLKVGLGDLVTITAETPRGVSNTVDVRVVAIADSAGFLSTLTAFVPLESARTLFGLNQDTASVLFLYLKDPRAIEQGTAHLRTVLERGGYTLIEHSAKPFFLKFEALNRETWTGQRLDVTTWEDEISFLGWALRTLDALSFLLIGILLAIIVVGIMNTLWIAIRERTREIGTLRAIGMHRKWVMGMFLFEAVLLGIGGAAAGAVTGVAIELGMNALALKVPFAVRMLLMSDTLRLSIHATSLVGAVLVVALVTAVAAIYPAYRAARLRPVTAMHHIG